MKCWSVSVSRDGEEVVTIGSSYISGRDIGPEDAETILLCARHLLSFLGRTTFGLALSSAVDVLNKLRDVIELEGQQKKAAVVLGVSPQHLTDVLHGRRGLSDKLLRGLGYRRIAMYEPVERGADE